MSNPVQFTTIVGELELVAGDCDMTATTVDTSLTALRTQVSELAALWLGAASTAYTTLMAEFDKDSKNLVLALRDIATGLRNNEHNYDNTETANFGAVQNVAESLPTINL